MNRTDVYELIDEERAYQNLRWNEQTTATEGKHATPEEWLTYMADYIAEAQHILSREPAQTSYPNAMSIIRKVTAMGVAAMEQIDTPHRAIV